jgi:hypothetical protein
MREVEHLHGMLGQEPAPWLLLCRDIDLLNTDGSTGLPTGYDRVYVDLMQTYRNAARTAMSVADMAGRVASPHLHAVALSWRIALQLESALWIYRGQNADPRLLIEIMAHEFECLTRRFDVIHRHSKEKAAECRMANMLVEDVLSHGTYELPASARRLVIAYSDTATPPQTTEPPRAQHARWYLRREAQRGGNAAFHMRGMQRYLAARALSPAHPPHDGCGTAGVGGVVDQKTRDTGYAAMPMSFKRTKEAMERQEHEEHVYKRAPLDQTEPRLEAELREADNVMAAEARPTGQYYRHYDHSTGEWERRWMASPQLPERIHRDPEVRREGNDVTQAAFQSPYAHLAALYYERMIFARHELSSLILREEEGAGRGPVQRATLGRDNYGIPSAHPSANVRSRHVPTAGHDHGAHRKRVRGSGSRSEGLRSECRWRDGARGLLPRH